MELVIPLTSNVRINLSTNYQRVSLYKRTRRDIDWTGRLFIET